MFDKLSIRLKQMKLINKDLILFIITLLVVTSVRTYYQYGKYLWNYGIGDLILTIFIHFIALLFIFLFVLVCLDIFFKDFATKNQRYNQDDITRIICLTLLIVSLSIIIVDIIGGNVAYDEYEERDWF